MIVLFDKPIVVKIMDIQYNTKETKVQKSSHKRTTDKITSLVSCIVGGDFAKLKSKSPQFVGICPRNRIKYINTKPSDLYTKIFY